VRDHCLPYDAYENEVIPEEVDTRVKSGCSAQTKTQLKNMAPAVTEGVVEHLESWMALKYNKVLNRNHAIDVVRGLIPNGASCEKALKMVCSQKSPTFVTLDGAEKYACSFDYEEGHDFESLAETCDGKEGICGQAMVCITETRGGPIKFVGVALVTERMEGKLSVLCRGTLGEVYIRVNEETYGHHVAVKNVYIKQAEILNKDNNQFVASEVPDISPLSHVDK